MTTATLADIHAKQAELDALRRQYSTTTLPPTQIDIAACTIALAPGERYAGAVLCDNGEPSHHLVLLAARPTGKVSWQAAMDWAASVGGALPNRQEQALLYANCKPHLQPEWHWSRETHEEDASYAWVCGFYGGYQLHDHKSFEGSAVAVRLIPISA